MKSAYIRSFSSPYFPVFELNTEIYRVNLTAWSVHIRSFSGPYFPVFEVNTEIYRVNLTSWKVSIFGVFLVRIFPYSRWIQRFTELIFGVFWSVFSRIRAIYLFILFIFNLFYVDDKIEYNLVYLCNNS